MPRLDRARFQVTVCSLGKETAMAQEMRDAGIEVVIADIGKWNPLAYRKIAALIEERRIELVHSHLGKSIVLGYFAARRAGARFVAHEHVGPMWPHFGGGPARRVENWIMSRATLFCMVRADSVIAVAKPTRNWIVARRPQLADKTTVITNGIKLDELKKVTDERSRHRARVRAEFGLPPDCPLVLYAASFRFVKRWDLFIQTAARMHARRPDVYFLGAGTGPLKAEMDRLVSELDMDDHVRLCGLRDDVPRLMAASELFLMPTAMECDPLTAKEALACGLPIVGSDIPPLRENIVDGQTGHLVRFGDAEDLAERGLELLNDDDQRREMRKAAVRKAWRQFSIDRCARRIEVVYSQVGGMA
ncbi:MAG: glycosyltransferase [Planctomycetota bacterium]